MKRISLAVFVFLLFISTFTQAQTVPLVKGPLTWNARIGFGGSAYGFNSEGIYVPSNDLGKLVLNITTPQNSAGFFLVTGYGTTARDAAPDVQTFPIVGTFIPVNAKFKYTSGKPSFYVLSFSVASNDITCKLDPGTLSGTCYRPGNSYPITYVSGK